MIPIFGGGTGKDLGDFRSRQQRYLHCSCEMHAAWHCHLGIGPKGQNIQRDTGGTDPISKNLTMGALKLCKYSLSEFQWWFWISQLPSRTSKNKRIKPSSLECRVALKGEGGFNAGNSYMGCADWLCFQAVLFLTAAFSCLEMFCSVRWVAVTANCLPHVPSPVYY